MVGDYQPYTNAHNYAHLKMIKDCSSIILYVLNPDYNNPKYNPFTQREVGKMIRNCYNEEDLKKIKIVFIKDTQEIKIKFKKNNVVEYSVNNNFYLKNNPDVNKIQINIPHEFKTEKEILDSLYSKKLELLDQVNPLNTKYLRRIVLPF